MIQLFWLAHANALALYNIYQINERRGVWLLSWKGKREMNVRSFDQMSIF